MKPWLDHGDVRLYHGDAAATLAELPAESAHCIVTSPPFWGLRDYGVDGQIGLEATPDEWCDRLVGVFRECRRVLRPDGVLWLECGDTYAGGGHSGNAYETRDTGMHGSFKVTTSSLRARSRTAPSRTAEGLKPKDLVGAPWLLAFALRADGWWLRSDCIWARPNPMPESVTDRPTKAHTYVFLLTKSARYFYDSDAVREPWADARNGASGATRSKYADMGSRGRGDGGVTTAPQVSGANLRSVWPIASEPTPFAHFATMPQAVVERCVKAGSSEHGVCSSCGAPWRRIVEREGVTPRELLRERGPSTYASGQPRNPQGLDYAGSHERTARATQTLGWEASCDHATAPVEPATILDPFAGSGTTLLVARRLGRRAVGIELSAEYLAIARERIGQPVLWSTPA